MIALLVTVVLIGRTSCSLMDIQDASDTRECKVPESNTTDMLKHCSRCSAGHGITMFCIRTNATCYKDTMCTECTPGTYQDQNNNFELCKVCRTCESDKGLQPLHNCNKTANTVCACKAGHFFDKISDRCTECSRCSAGEQPLDCSGESDTKCKVCESGTFSDGVDACKPCRKCGVDLRVESNCTSSSDTVCVRTQLRGYPDVGDTDSSSGSGSLMIYVSCGLMGLVVVTVVTYAMWKHCNRSIEKKRTTAVYSHNNNNPQLYLYMTIDKQVDETKPCNEVRGKPQTPVNDSSSPPSAIVIEPTVNNCISRSAPTECIRDVNQQVFSGLNYNSNACSATT